MKFQTLIALSEFEARFDDATLRRPLVARRNPEAAGGGPASEPSRKPETPAIIPDDDAPQPGMLLPGIMDDAPRPVVDTPQPDLAAPPNPMVLPPKLGDAPQPAGDAPQPDMAAPRNPMVLPPKLDDTPRPVGDAPEPVGDASQPDTVAPPNPMVLPPKLDDAPQPAGDTPRPVGGAPQPAGDTPQPAGDAPQPVGDAPRPIGDAPQLVGDAPQPVGVAPQPVGVASNRTDGSSSKKALSPGGDDGPKLVDKSGSSIEVQLQHHKDTSAEVQALLQAYHQEVDAFQRRMQRYEQDVEAFNRGAGARPATAREHKRLVAEEAALQRLDGELNAQGEALQLADQWLRANASRINDRVESARANQRRTNDRIRAEYLREETPEGVITREDTDGDGKIDRKTLTDPDGNVASETQYHYADDGTIDRVVVTTPEGVETHLDTDGDGKFDQKTLTDLEGNQTADTVYHYTNDGTIDRMVVTTPEGVETHLDTDGDGKIDQKTLIDAEGNQTTDTEYHYADDGTIDRIVVTTPEGVETHLDTDGDGKIDQKTLIDAEGNQTSDTEYHYTDDGTIDRIVVTTPEGVETHLDTDGDGKIDRETLTDPDGNQTTDTQYHYTDDGKVDRITVTTPEGVRVHTDSDGDGKIDRETLTDPDGNQTSDTQYHFADDGKVDRITVTTPEGVTVHTDSNGDGKIDYVPLAGSTGDAVDIFDRLANGGSARASGLWSREQFTGTWHDISDMKDDSGINLVGAIYQIVNENTIIADGKVALGGGGTGRVKTTYTRNPDGTITRQSRLVNRYAKDDAPGGGGGGGGSREYTVAADGSVSYTEGVHTYTVNDEDLRNAVIDAMNTGDATGLSSVDTTTVTNSDGQVMAYSLSSTDAIDAAVTTAQGVFNPYQPTANNGTPHPESGQPVYFDGAGNAFYDAGLSNPADDQAQAYFSGMLDTDRDGVPDSQDGVADSMGNEFTVTVPDRFLPDAVRPAIPTVGDIQANAAALPAAAARGIDTTGLSISDISQKVFIHDQTAFVEQFLGPDAVPDGQAPTPKQLAQAQEMYDDDVASLNAQVQGFTIGRETSDVPPDGVPTGGRQGFDQGLALTELQADLQRVSEGKTSLTAVLAKWEADPRSATLMLQGPRERLYGEEVGEYEGPPTSISATEWLTQAVAAETAQFENIFRQVTRREPSGDRARDAAVLSQYGENPLTDMGYAAEVQAFENIFRQVTGREPSGDLARDAAVLSQYGENAVTDMGYAGEVRQFEDIFRQVTGREPSGDLARDAAVLSQYGENPLTDMGYAAEVRAFEKTFREVTGREPSGDLARDADILSRYGDNPLTDMGYAAEVRAFEKTFREVTGREPSGDLARDADILSRYGDNPLTDMGHASKPSDLVHTWGGVEVVYLDSDKKPTTDESEAMFRIVTKEDGSQVGEFIDRYDPTDPWAQRSRYDEEGIRYESLELHPSEWLGASDQTQAAADIVDQNMVGLFIDEWGTLELKDQNRAVQRHSGGPRGRGNTTEIEIRGIKQEWITGWDEKGNPILAPGWEKEVIPLAENRRRIEGLNDDNTYKTGDPTFWARAKPWVQVVPGASTLIKLHDIQHPGSQGGSDITGREWREFGSEALVDSVYLVGWPYGAINLARGVGMAAARGGLRAGAKQALYMGRPDRLARTMLWEPSLPNVSRIVARQGVNTVRNLRNPLTSLGTKWKGTVKESASETGEELLVEYPFEVLSPHVFGVADPRKPLFTGDWRNPTTIRPGSGWIPSKDDRYWMAGSIGTFGLLGGQGARRFRPGDQFNINAPTLASAQSGGRRDFGDASQQIPGNARWQPYGGMRRHHLLSDEPSAGFQEGGAFDAWPSGWESLMPAAPGGYQRSGSGLLLPSPTPITSPTPTGIPTPTISTTPTDTPTPTPSPILTDPFNPPALIVPSDSPTPTDPFTSPVQIAPLNPPTPTVIPTPTNPFNQPAPTAIPTPTNPFNPPTPTAIPTPTNPFNPPTPTAIPTPTNPFTPPMPTGIPTPPVPFNPPTPTVIPNPSTPTPTPSTPTPTPGPTPTPTPTPTPVPTPTPTPTPNPGPTPTATPTPNPGPTPTATPTPDRGRGARPEVVAKASVGMYPRVIAHDEVIRVYHDLDTGEIVTQPLATPTEPVILLEDSTPPPVGTRFAGHRSVTPRGAYVFTSAVGKRRKKASAKRHPYLRRGELGR